MFVAHNKAIYIFDSLYDILLNILSLGIRYFLSLSVRVVCARARAVFSSPFHFTKSLDGKTIGISVTSHRNVMNATD